MKNEFYRKKEAAESEDSRKMKILVDSVIAKKARIETIRVNEPDLFETILELGREEVRSGSRVSYSSKSKNDAFCSALRDELERTGFGYAPSYDA